LFLLRTAPISLPPDPSSSRRLRLTPLPLMQAAELPEFLATYPGTNATNGIPGSRLRLPQPKAVTTPFQAFLFASLLSFCFPFGLLNR